MQAEKSILEQGGNKEVCTPAQACCVTVQWVAMLTGLPMQYLPIEGLASFRKATVELLLGADHAAIKDVRSLLWMLSAGSASAPWTLRHLSCSSCAMQP